MHSNLLRKAGILIFCLLLSGCVEEKKNGQPLGKAESRTALRIFVVRHAEAYKNLPHPAEMSEEKLDSLTPKGIEQALTAGRLLKNKGVVAVIASPPKRQRSCTGRVGGEWGKRQISYADDQQDR